MLIYNCRCFFEKFLGSLGTMPGLFRKKDMSNVGGALQHKKFFQKSIILIAEHLSQNPMRSNISYWIRKCVKDFLGEKRYSYTTVKVNQ